MAQRENSNRPNIHTSDEDYTPPTDSNDVTGEPEQPPAKRRGRGKGKGKKAELPPLTEKEESFWGPIATSPTTDGERIQTNAENCLVYWRQVFNFIEDEVVFRKNLMTRNLESLLSLEHPGQWRPLSDTELLRFTTSMFQDLVHPHGMTVSFGEKNRKALNTLAEEYWPADPALDYMRQLTWDGVTRVPTIFQTLFDAEDTEHTRLAARCFFNSLAARQLQPGCKQDTSLILEGPEGCYKSQFAAAILPQPEFFGELKVDLGNKDALLGLGARCVIEVPEMLSLVMSKRNAAVKAFLTSSIDKYRPPYASAEEEIPRRCVFLGTINPVRNAENRYLASEEGNRRFHPVKVNRKIDLQVWGELRDQVLAEAFHNVTKFLENGDNNEAHPGCWWVPVAKEGTMRIEVMKRERKTDAQRFEGEVAEALAELKLRDAEGNPREQALTKILPVEILVFLGEEREVAARQRRKLKAVAAALGELGFVQEDYPDKKLSDVFPSTEKVGGRWMIFHDRQAAQDELDALRQSERLADQIIGGEED